MKLTERPRALIIASVAAASFTLSASGCAGSPAAPAASGTTAPSSEETATRTPPASPVTAGPLVLAHFPSTTDGKLARNECERWSRLRVAYYARVQEDTPYQLNQWFSNPDWSAIDADGAALGDDLTYGHIETAFGSGMVGDVASIATAREIDRACSNGN